MGKETAASPEAPESVRPPGLGRERITKIIQPRPQGPSELPDLPSMGVGAEAAGSSHDLALVGNMRCRTVPKICQEYQ
jgi:hypothetical protein